MPEEIFTGDPCGPGKGDRLIRDITKNGCGRTLTGTDLSQLFARLPDQLGCATNVCTRVSAA